VASFKEIRALSSLIENPQTNSIRQATKGSQFLKIC
jgi:hypothetical protein